MRPSSPRWWVQLACRRAAQADCGESPSSGRAGGGSHGLSRCLPPCLAPGVQITWTGAGPVALRQNLLLVSLLTESLTHFLTVRALCQALGRGGRPAAGRCLSLPCPTGLGVVGTQAGSRWLQLPQEDLGASRRGC